MMHENIEIDEKEYVISKDSESLDGFGGWLILFQLKVFLSMMIMFAGFFQDFELFSHMNIMRIGILIAVLALFYHHNKAFKIFYVLSVIVGLIIMIVAYPPYSIAIFVIIESCFIIYLYKSKRVKHNFS